MGLVWIGTENLLITTSIRLSSFNSRIAHLIVCTKHHDETGPHRGSIICVPPQSVGLCWVVLLPLQSHSPDWSMVRGQTKLVPCLSRLVGGLRAVPYFLKRTLCSPVPKPRCFAARFLSQMLWLRTLILLLSRSAQTDSILPTRYNTTNVSPVAEDNQRRPVCCIPKSGSGIGCYCSCLLGFLSPSFAFSSISSVSTSFFFPYFQPSLQFLARLHFATIGVSLLVLNAGRRSNTVDKSMSVQTDDLGPCASIWSPRSLLRL
ncbi:unnamed protein product, partial [Dicrocoelium dendriticum]